MVAWVLGLAIASAIVAVSTPLPPINNGKYGGPAPRGVTLAQYNQLATGMSYAEATRVLGMQGVEQSRSGATITYWWQGITFASHMNAVFQNDQLTAKSEFLLQ